MASIGYVVTFLLSCLLHQSLCYQSYFQDIPTNVLQRHIKFSRHQPFCVVFRQAEEGSKLEKVMYDLWQAKNKAGNFTQWQVNAFNPYVSKMPPNNERPDSLPAMRCYLGETSSYQYQGRHKKSLVKEWLGRLASLFAEQSAEVNQEAIEIAQRSHDILLLAFPDGPRHHQVEDMIYGIARELDSCKAMAVHLNSNEVVALRHKYAVNRYPSVVVIHNKVINSSIHETSQVFTGHEVDRHVIKVYIEARSIGVPYLNFDELESMITISKTGEEMTPVLVCFYAHWGKDVHTYLHAYNETVNSYTQDGVLVKFGLVDLVRESSKKIATRYLKSGAMKYIPFLVLFHTDSTGKLQAIPLHVGRPFPWVMYEPLSELGIGVIERAGIRKYAEPWGTLGPDQFCSLQEGPNGTLCTVGNHNETDNIPYIRPAVMKPVRVIDKPVIKEAIKEKKWHDIFDTDSLERKLDVHAGIPVVTLDTWANIVEKSHAPRHVFYPAGKWAGEVAKVSLVVFIMSDCGNCRRNNQTFKDIHTAISHIDGGAMYYVNCTEERTLCSKQHVRGFPTIAAYRGLGWLETKSCMTEKSRAKFSKSVRVDYHGVIRTGAVLDWFSRIADNAVTNLQSGGQPPTFKEKDIQLIAMVTASTTPVARVMGYECLRLMCERLFSIIDCFSFSFSDEGVLGEEASHMSVTRVEMKRRDGVHVVLMEQGRSLADTLENTENNDLHRFHVSHSYKLNETQLCEDDIGVCTDVITEFILDHSRLPITQLTSDTFHTSTSFFKDDKLPILIALGYKENITDSAVFRKNLEEVAYEMYSQIVVMTLDVSKYSVWATQFVPHLYGHTRVYPFLHDVGQIALSTVQTAAVEEALFQEKVVAD
ncbi:hypothetical protein DPMN_056760 [Dreissena polymorpha]|uniref:Thioredoxin domain-containing protein n=1 Tax=Dreissena polymorpha TaxID=45954 RepID=A0A9D4HTX0_DREPO|nr:hypothetical protein DPMN_056760 [Dreissena polymorpha]